MHVHSKTGHHRRRGHQTYGRCEEIKPSDTSGLYDTFCIIYLSPLSKITNTVVSTQSANITLALGASPIMAFDAQEMEDIVKVCGACLINIGTLTNATRDGMLKAGIHSITFSTMPLVHKNAKDTMPIETIDQLFLTQ